MEGQISRMMHDAGKGGLGPCGRHLWTSLGELATGLSSLVRYLKTIGLRIRVGYAETEGWELACNCEQNTQARIEMNARGIVLRSELEEGGKIPIRVGQCWEYDGRALEILGFRDDQIETMEWECENSITIGRNIEEKDGNRPQGMGGSVLIGKEEFIEQASHLLELSVDKVTKGGEGKLTCKLMARRNNTACERAIKIPDYLKREWACWGGGDFTHIYTDGSYKEEATWGDQLLGTVKRIAGGSVIISDGMSWFHKIYVKIDVEVEDAGQVELICLLIANEIAMAEKRAITIRSDCKSALNVIEGAYSERFANILSGWKKWEGSNTEHISAHPERHKAWGTWEWDDMGIYVADRVAGGFSVANRTISAREWLLRISAQSKVAIEEEDGTPFIGSVSRRASRISMKHYFMERDGYNENDPDFEERWEGANMARAQKLLRRNGGFEDLVTMMKLGAGKRWDVSRHNKADCVLCEEEFSSQRHPMMTCVAIEVHNARELWKNNIKALIAKAKWDLRPEMENYFSNILSKPDGEMAAVGTYTVRWVNNLNKDRIFGHVDWKSMIGLMKAIAQGARGVMRVYTRACCDKTREKGKLAKGYTRALELRQLSIGEFVGQEVTNRTDSNNKVNKEKKGNTTLKESDCAPPAGTLEEIERGGLGLVGWRR
jgi:hypothetical protein